MNLLAVDARDGERARVLAAFLQQHEDLGHLLYETGKSRSVRHRVPPGRTLG